MERAAVKSGDKRMQQYGEEYSVPACIENNRTYTRHMHVHLSVSFEPGPGLVGEREGE